MYKRILLTSLSFLFAGIMNAQDAWTVSEPGGFGNSWNEFINALHPFKGDLYAGNGTNAGGLYRSPSGTVGTWTQVLAGGGGAFKVSAINSTAEGGGYIYASTYAFGGDSARVYRSFDGTSWTPYFTGYYEDISHVVPYMGTGSVDSIYVIENNYYGAKIYRSGYATNDPNSLMGSWDTVLDFNILLPYAQVKSTLIHSGRFYIGLSTPGGGELWSSNDGTNWVKNDSVGDGFGDSGNTQITALEAFGGYIYAGTYNYSGAQLWRSADQLNWSLVNTYGSSTVITDLEATATELWIAANNASVGGGFIERTTDGITYITSSNDGFGINGNQGQDAVLKVFGNNMYYGTRNFYTGGGGAIAKPGSPATRGGGSSTGGEIWRTCLITPPTFSLGNDTTICNSEQITLDAGPAVSYYWNVAGITTQTAVVGPGTYTCQITAANGCDASDQVIVSGITSPTIYSSTPYFGSSYYVCKGDSMTFNTSATTGLYVLQPPFTKITHDTIDSTLGDNFDTLTVAGVPSSCSCTSLISLTIDSIRHTYANDIVIGITDPGGSYIDLVQFGYGNGADDAYWGTEFRMDATNYLSTSTPPFTGLFQPDGYFGNLLGNPNGNWILKVGDVAGGDEGNLLGWTLKFGYADTIMTISWTGAGLSSTTTFTPVATPPATTTYALSVTSQNGCTSVDSLQLIVPAVDVPSSGVACYGGSYTVTATGTSGGSSTTWTPATGLDVTTGSTVVSTPTANITYYVMDTIAGCALIDSIHVYANPQLFATATPAVSTCFNVPVALIASPSGGTPGYTYNWNDGSSNYAVQTLNANPATSTSYTLMVTDTNGCTAYDYTSVAVIPSIDLRGHVSYSGGNVTAGNVVAFQYIPTFIKFDTIQTVALNASGDYLFTALQADSYLVKVFPDTLIYPTLNSTYYGNEFMWDSATVVNHGCSMTDTADIVMIEETGFAGGGLGFLRGRISEDFGFGRAPGEPIPGIDVKLGKNPGGAMVTSTTTDTAGYYTFTAVDYNASGENYILYVDIPGLGMDSAYVPVVNATTPVYLYLDYTVDSTTIHIVPNAGVGISNPAVAQENHFNVYPNPTNDNATVEFTLAQDSELNLEIYNVLGEKTSTLFSGRHAAGICKYNLDGLRAGVYFVSLNVNGKNTTQRIVVMD